jgi:flagellar biosynthetic protein FlhB
VADDFDQQQERTEQATAKRLKDARERGQVPRSRELSTTLVLLAGAGCLYGAGAYMSRRLVSHLRAGLEFRPEWLDSPNIVGRALGAATINALTDLWPVFATVFIAALAAPLALGGWNFSTQALVPDFSRLSPIAGFRRIFGWQGLVELVKALAKCLLVGGVAAIVIYAFMGDAIALGRMPVAGGIAAAGKIVGTAFIWMSAALVVVAAIDVPFQLWDYQHRLRMSRHEVREELKETDGRPEVKSRIRQLQQQLARRRMMEQVPKADVVITNPTHYAVALRYDAPRMRAPRVVAKGADLVALAIRRVAEAHKVPTFESPLLARALYRSVDIGKEIPGGLYVAVAQVLTYIYQMRRLTARDFARIARPQPTVAAEFLEK